MVYLPNVGYFQRIISYSLDIAWIVREVMFFCVVEFLLFTVFLPKQLFFRYIIFFKPGIFRAKKMLIFLKVSFKIKQDFTSIQSEANISCQSMVKYCIC